MAKSRKNNKKRSDNARYQATSVALTLARANNQWNVLSNIRKGASVGDFSIVIKEISKFKNIKFSTINGNSINEVAELGNVLNPAALDIEKELKWARAVLLNHTGKINEYLSYSTKFSKSLLKGDFEDAERQLDKIETNFGQSLWLIKNKIAFLQVAKGLEAQKQYVQKIKEAVSFKGQVAFLSHWISVRNEGTVTPARFSSQIESLFNKMPLSNTEGFQIYVKYHVQSVDNIPAKDFVHILRRDFTQSFIDYYESFLAAVRVVCAYEPSSVRNRILYAVEKLANQVNDDRIKLLIASLSSVDMLPKPPSESIEAYELYLAGNYDLSFELASKALSLYSDDPLAIIVLSLSKSVINRNLKGGIGSVTSVNTNESNKVEQPLSQLIVDKLSVVASSGLSAIQEVNDLMKLTLNFSYFEWAASINLFLLSEKKYIGDFEKEALIENLKLNYVHPVFIDLASNSKIKSNLLQSYIDFHGEDVALEYTLLNKGSIGYISKGSLSQDALYLSECKYLYDIEDYEKVIRKSEILINSVANYYSRKGHWFLSNALYNSDEIVKLCTHIASNYVEYPNLYSEFPLAKVSKLLTPENEHWKDLSTTPTLSIVLDAYTRHVSKDREAELGYACEDFVTYNGLQRPSEFVKLSKKIDKYILYYLRYICVESVIDTSVVYEGSDDVTSERLNICRLLSDIDPNNNDAYKQEIQNLVRRQIIGSRMQEIEQSKIYVDVAKVKEWANKELYESYSRYIEYVRHGLDEQTLAKREEAKALVADSEIEKLVAMSVPDNEANALFKHIVIELRDAYASSYDFGLDRYISTRIRHGGLENSLRRPLDEYNLITKREGENGPYKSNSYWLNKSVLTDSESKILDTSFSKFSLNYDLLITKIRTEWLQVRRSVEEIGLFNFILVDGQISLIAARVDEETTFSKMIDIIINYLSEILTDNLTIIRERLSLEAKPAARDLITRLQMDISALAIDEQLSELNTGINMTRTVIQDVFDKVTEWFSPSESGGASIYEIEDAVSVAEAIVREASPNFLAPFKLKDDCTGVVMQGALPMFVDVLVNAFENVVRHSGLNEPQAEVLLYHELVQNNIRVVSIDISNKLGEGVDVADISNKILRINALLKTGKYGRSVATEGGSGSFKIHRSLGDLQATTTDLKAEMALEVIEDEFFVKIKIPLRQLSSNLGSEDYSE